MSGFSTANPLQSRILSIWRVLDFHEGSFSITYLAVYIFLEASMSIVLRPSVGTVLGRLSSQRSKIFIFCCQLIRLGLEQSPIHSFHKCLTFLLKMTLSWCQKFLWAADSEDFKLVIVGRRCVIRLSLAVFRFKILLFE